MVGSHLIGNVSMLPCLLFVQKNLSVGIAVAGENSVLFFKHMIHFKHVIHGHYYVILNPAISVSRFESRFKTDNMDK